jgi:hypothetical protein
MSGAFLLRSSSFERSRSVVNLPFLELPLLLPKILDWVEAQEKFALSQGSALSPAAINDARTAGVRAPENIRMVAVSEIPEPEHPKIKQVAAELGLITSRTVAITFGFGIFVRTEQSNDRETLVHECVHVAQYEKLGMDDFLMQYVVQIFKNGYDNAPMEREAREVAARIAHQ